jgi:hypothetical protein
MEEWEPVPIEVMMGCFIAAGFVVSVVCSIDWSRVF